MSLGQSSGAFSALKTPVSSPEKTLNNVKTPLLKKLESNTVPSAENANPAKKKRGRPPKAKVSVDSVPFPGTTLPSSVPHSLANSTEPPKKKRGRPPKSKNPADSNSSKPTTPSTSIAVPTITPSNVAKSELSSSASSTSTPSGSSNVPKKRGRPKMTPEQKEAARIARAASAIPSQKSNDHDDGKKVKKQKPPGALQDNTPASVPDASGPSVPLWKSSKYTPTRFLPDPDMFYSIRMAQINTLTTLEEVAEIREYMRVMGQIMDSWTTEIDSIENKILFDYVIQNEKLKQNLKREAKVVEEKAKTPDHVSNSN